jgi:hypothetical protein
MTHAATSFRLSPCGLDAARLYAEAKSRQDIAAALSVCAPEFVLETIPFQTRAVGAEEVAHDLRAFFDAFPDYGFLTEGAVSADGQVTVWGRARMTFGPLRRRIDVPATAVYDIRDGLLARERFLFDMREFCRQLGIPAFIVARLMARQQRRRARDVHGSAAARTIHVENSVVIDAPIEDVFERSFADVRQLMRGNLRWLRADDIELVGGGFEPGAIRRVHVSTGRATDELLEVVDRPRLIRYRILNGWGAAIDAFVAETYGSHELEPLGDLTRVTWRGHIVPRGRWARPVAAVLARAILHRVQRRFLDSLARAASASTKRF